MLPLTLQEKLHLGRSVADILRAFSDNKLESLGQGGANPDHLLRWLRLVVDR